MRSIAERSIFVAMIIVILGLLCQPLNAAAFEEFAAAPQERLGEEHNIYGVEGQIPVEPEYPEQGWISDDGAELTTAAGYGTFVIENHTPYDIKIYVDGRYLGIVHSGYKVTITKVPAGNHRFLGKSTDGRYRWGPRKVRIRSGKTFTLKLVMS